MAPRNTSRVSSYTCTKFKRSKFNLAVTHAQDESVDKIVNSIMQSRVGLSTIYYNLSTMLSSLKHKVLNSTNNVLTIFDTVKMCRIFCY